MIFKRRHCDRVNIAQIMRFYRPNMIAKATAQGHTDYCRKEGFQGAGEADAPDGAEVSGADEFALVPVPDDGNNLSGAVAMSGALECAAGAAEELGNSVSGAVVISGVSDAGGGSDESVSDAGKGASLFGAPGFAAAVAALRSLCAVSFFLPVCATGKAG